MSVVQRATVKHVCAQVGWICRQQIMNVHCSQNYKLNKNEIRCVKDSRGLIVYFETRRTILEAMKRPTLEGYTCSLIEK